MTKDDFQRLAKECDLDWEFIRARYHKGMRGPDLIKPKMTASKRARSNTKSPFRQYNPDWLKKRTV